MTEQKIMSGLRYEVPRVELLTLTYPLNLLESFSMKVGTEDWDKGDLLDNELEY